MMKKNIKNYDLPKDDPRTKMILAAIKKESGKPDSLIQILHTAQNLYGYLPMNVIGFITQQLGVPPSRVFGVVTFYHFFSLKPKGEHTCLVCTGTACYVKGAQTILEEIEKKYSLKPGEVTPDNHLGLQTARCIGACGLAPAVVIDDNIVAKVKPEEVGGIIHSRIGDKK
ncbi:MAG: NAD(P)H-dependent oxidoreductase subunit E [Candidatus Omnitrophota bacterium]